MKHTNYKIVVVLVTALLVSCTIHDPVDNVMKIGKIAPHTYWELKSSTVRAGEPVAFLGQYYTTADTKINHSEVWYNVTENIVRTVSAPLVTSLKYNITLNESHLAREQQMIISYRQNENLWNLTKRAYILDTIFPTSTSLKPVEWKEVKTFDDKKFKDYFPAGFDTHFKDSLYNLLKVEDFRKIMTTLNVMTETDFKTYVDSTFNNNSGKYDYFIKEAHKADLKTKYQGIAFKDLIYDHANSIYKIDYEKSYVLRACFKVIDSGGTKGTSEYKDINLR